MTRKIDAPGYHQRLLGLAEEVLAKDVSFVFEGTGAEREWTNPSGQHRLPNDLPAVHGWAEATAKIDVLAVWLVAFGASRRRRQGLNSANPHVLQAPVSSSPAPAVAAPTQSPVPRSNHPEGPEMPDRPFSRNRNLLLYSRRRRSCWRE